MKGVPQEFEAIVFGLRRDLDEMRGAHNRVAERQTAVVNDIRRLVTVANKLDDTILTLDALIDVLISAKVITAEKFAEKSAELFDAKYGFVKIDPDTQEELGKDEFAMIKFKYVDALANVIFDTKNFVMYQTGAGRLPFESKIKSLKPGMKEEFEFTFPEGFQEVKELAGKTAKVVLETQVWKKLLPRPTAPQKAEGPKQLNEQGDVQ